MHGEFKPNQVLNITNNTFFPAELKRIIAKRNVNTQRDFDANGLQFAFKHLFPKEGENITADVNYFSRQEQ